MEDLKEYITNSPAEKRLEKTDRLMWVDYPSYHQWQKEAVYFDSIEQENTGAKPIESKTFWVLGNYSPEQCKESFEKGISDEKAINTMKQAKVFSGKKIKIGEVIKRRKKFNEYDGDINMDKAMSGSSDFFEKKTKVNRKERLKTYYIDIVLTANHGSDVYNQRLTKILSLICQDILKGKAVEIFGYLGNDGAYREKSLMRFPIKTVNERLDLHKFAAITYPSFFRHYTLAMIRCAFNERHRVNGHLGRNLEPKKSIKLLVDTFKKQQGYYFHCQTDTFYEFKGKDKIEEIKL